MHGRDSLSALISEMLKTPEPVTLTKRVEVTEIIVDAILVAATPQAARLYGYQDVNAFCGVWLSKTQPLIEAHRSHHLSAARHFQDDLPEQYITTIVQPNGTQVSVIKTTRELTLQGETYWFTKLQPASEQPNVPHIRDIHIPTLPDGYEDFSGVLSIAETEVLLQKALRSIPATKHHSARLASMPASSLREGAEPLYFHQAVTDIGNGQQILECQSCGHVWTTKTDKRLPIRCANSERRCYNWQTPPGLSDLNTHEIRQTIRHISAVTPPVPARSLSDTAL